MKIVGIIAAILVGLAFVFFVIEFADHTVAPLFLNSRIQRLHETGLPKLRVERGGIVYCRMKADDFRFPLPPGSQAAHSTISGGFDTVKGTIDARFDGTNVMTASGYESFISGKIPSGGWVTAEAVPGGLHIDFSYFGDR